MDDRPRLVLPQLRLDELLDELQSRLGEVRGTRDRLQALLEAVLAVGSDLDLQTVLHRIVEAAARLAGARYAALGVIGEDGALAQFHTVGVDDDVRQRIGDLPHGHGILGLLIRDPHPLRLDDLAQDKASYGFPPGHPPMKTFLGVPVRVRDEVFGNLYLTEKQGGGPFDEEDEAVVLALAAAAGVAIENARLYEVARRREQWLSASTEVTTRLLGGAEPEEVLTLVARRARELSGTAACFVALPSGPGRLLVEVAEGDGVDQLRGTVLPVHGSPCGQVLSSGTAVRLLGEPASAVLGTQPVGSALLVPLGEARGVLVVSSPVGEPVVPLHVQGELSAFAAQATLALEVAERRRDAERLVVLEDRDRIARDLHDLVIQRLFATGMSLEGAARMTGNPDAQDRVRRAVDDLDTTIREIRSTIYALTRQPQDERASLRSRLFDVVDAGTEQLGRAPAVRLSGLVDTSVPDDVAEHLLAVLREALSNAARHAGAERVEVVVDVGDTVQLLVRDDGVGIDPHVARRSGLANLADRATAVGGTFEVRRGPGSGTELVWTAPV